MKNKTAFPKGNYQKKIVEMIQSGEISSKPGAIRAINVTHDSWCSIFKGGICDCNPTVTTSHTQYQ